MTIYAIEDLEGFDGLEIEELVNKEKDAAKSGEYEALKDYVEEVVEAQNNAEDTEDTSAESSDPDAPSSDDTPADPASDEPPAEPSDSDEPTPGSDSGGETPDNEASGTDQKTEGEAKKDDEALVEKDGKKTSAIAESLREEYYDRLILEGIDSTDVKDTLKSGARVLGGLAWGAGRLLGNGLVVVGQFGLETLGRLAAILRDLGIQYSPVVAKAIKMGVIYLFTKSVKSLFKLIVSVSNWTKRYYLNIDKRQKEITQLKLTLETLRGLAEKPDLTGKRFTDEKTLSWFTTEHAVSPMNSAGVVSRFFKEAITQIDHSMQYDVGLVKKLIDLSETGIRGDLVGYLRVQPFSGPFLRRNVKGYVKDPELVESFVYREGLPDRVVFVATLPKTNLKEMEAISHAYNASGVFLAVDDQARPVSDGIDYMDIEALTKYLDVLEELCQTAKAHKAFFNRVVKDAESLKFGYKHYYQKMIESEEQSTVRSSLVEYVYHKQSFTTKVYAPAAMDVHDFVTAYLLRALRFAKDNVKALSS